MKNRNEGRTKKKQETDKQRDREKRGRSQEGWLETKGNTEKQTQMAFCAGEKQLFVSISSKERKTKENKKQNKWNKEGLGPSEVALWATSPDPETLPKTIKTKTKKQNQ